MQMSEQRTIIEEAWENRALLEDKNVQGTIRSIIDQLDKGDLRVAEPTATGWQVNEWVKKAVVLYFPIQGMETMHAGPLEFHDKIPLKTGYKEKGIRVVPHACRSSWCLYFTRYDSYAELCQHWSLCR